LPIETISTKTGDLESIDTQFEFDDLLDDAVARYGHEVVFSRYKAQLTIDLQAFIRTKMKASIDAATIQTSVDSWKPGVKSRPKNALEKADDFLSKLTNEQREELFSRHS